MDLVDQGEWGKVLEEVLKKAGLPDIPGKIVGHQYRIGCREGEKWAILCGVIEAVEVTDQGIRLHISSSELHERFIRHAYHAEGKWLLLIEEDVDANFNQPEVSLEIDFELVP